MSRGPNFPRDPNLPPGASILRPAFVEVIQNMAADGFAAIEAEANRIPPSGSDETRVDGWYPFTDEVGVDVAGISLPDAARVERNEDRIGIAESGRLLFVLDAMGAHAGSKVAAHIAERVLRECFANQPDVMDDIDAARLVEEAMRTANSAIVVYNQLRKSDTGVCAALVWLYERPDGSIGLSAVNAGDCRVVVWLPNHDKLDHVTRDQSGAPGWQDYMQEYFATIETEDQLSDEELIAFRQRHQVSGGLGEHPYSGNQVIYFEGGIGPGIRILLCSDGLHDVLTDPQIVEELSLRLRPAETVEALAAKTDRKNAEGYIRHVRHGARATYTRKATAVREKLDDNSMVLAVLRRLRPSQRSAP